MSSRRLLSSSILEIKPLPVFFSLQLLDFATTIVALELGGAEQNPLVNHFLTLGPFAGLIVSKLLVVALAALFVLGGKLQPIRLANVGFALIIAWNLTIIARLAIIT